MMKQKLLYLFSALAAAFCGSCSDDYDAEGHLTPSLSAHYLMPSQTEFYFTASASSESFNVASFETAWKFTGMADWVNLSPQSGRESAFVELSVSENPSAEDARTSIFYLHSDVADWDYNRALSVSQDRAIPALSVDNKSLSFGGAAETQTVKVTANCNWTAQCANSWVTLTSNIEEGTLTLSVEANPNETYRTSIVYVNYGSSRSERIDLTQMPSSISASTYTLEYENTASKYDVTIESEMAWTAVASQTWIQVTPSSGDAGKTTVSIEVTPNTSTHSRTGYVTIKTGDTNRLQITLEQKGVYIEADASLEFSSRGETKKLQVRSNTDWTVQSKPDWVTLSKSSGNGTEEITVTATENSSTTARSGNIVIGQSGLDLTCTVRVTQQGVSLTLGTSLLEFTDKAGSQSFDLVADASWSSTLSASWFSATPTSGSGNATVNVSVTENNSTDERNGTITYAYADKSASVAVHQLAKYFTIDNQTFNFDSKGGTHTIELSTNDTWTAEIEGQASWLKLSQTSGTSSATLTLTVSDNPSVNVRSATIDIHTNNCQSVKIQVSQKARYLKVSTASILFFANGGTSEAVNIETDGTYDISSSATWFTVNKATNSFTVSATKNTSSSNREGKVTVKLTDLKEGTLSVDIPVTQAGEGGSFIINGYTEDKDWNHTGSGSLTLTVNGYTSDKNWNENTNSGLTVNITGYTTDKNWNSNTNSNGNTSITGYGTDDNWNINTNSDGNISITGYGTDNNWNN